MRSVLFTLLMLSSTSALAQPAATPPAPAPAPAPSSPAASAPATPPAPAVIPRGNGLTAVVVADLPEACRDLGKLADSRSANQALSARISLASCLVEQRMKTIPLCDCEQSVRDLDAASDQSFVLLQEVIAVGDPATKILALQAQGDLLLAFATRVLATVPQAIDGTEASLALRETRLQMIQPLVMPWQQRARSAYQQIDTLARANPQLAKNPAVLAAVRASRAKLSQVDNGVAKR